MYDPAVLVEVLKLLKQIGKNELYQKYRTDIEKVLLTSCPEKNQIQFCDEAVGLIQGSISDLDRALSLYYQKIRLYVAYWHSCTQADLDSVIEKSYTIPKEKFREIISKDILQFLDKKIIYLEKLSTEGLTQSMIDSAKERFKSFQELGEKIQSDTEASVNENSYGEKQKSSGHTVA